MIDNFRDPAPQQPAEPDIAFDGMVSAAVRGAAGEKYDDVFEEIPMPDDLPLGPSPVGVYEPHDIVDLDDLDPRDDYLQYEGVPIGMSFDEYTHPGGSPDVSEDVLGDYSGF
jgi:hypothetical protein